MSRVARRAFAEAGIGPDDISVAEVHDSIAFNELLAEFVKAAEDTQASG